MRLEKRKVNMMLLDGGIGDHVASLVAVDYAINKYPHITPIVWVPAGMKDFAINVLPYKTDVRSLHELTFNYDRDLPTKTTKWDGVTSPMKIHCVDYAFLKLLDENPSIEHKNYLRVKFNKVRTNKGIRNLINQSQYVVITAGYTAEVREFPTKEINRIVNFIKSKGLEVVFLGQNNTKTGTGHVISANFSGEINFDAGINLINETTLLEAALIMHHSRAVVGVDNGLMHVAGCTAANIIGGFTTVSPEIRKPVRSNSLNHRFWTVTPDESLDCRFCQEKTNFLYEHDYRNCIHKGQEKERTCVKQMTADKFIYHLERIL